MDDGQHESGHYPIRDTQKIRRVLHRYTEGWGDEPHPLRRWTRPQEGKRIEVTDEKYTKRRRTTGGNGCGYYSQPMTYFTWYTSGVRR